MKKEPKKRGRPPGAKNIKNRPKPKPPGRPRVLYPTLEEAKLLARARGLTSRESYFRWHKENNVKFLPPRPDIYYNGKNREMWTSWPEFLGTRNVFRGCLDQRKNWRPYWDAVRYVQSLKLSGQTEYWAKYKAGEIPEDIPRNPHSIYPEFDSYITWIGKGMSSKLDAAMNEDPIWSMVHMNNEPGNVFWWLKFKSLADLNDKKQDSWQIMGMWKWEQELEQDVKYIIDNSTSMYYDANQRLCSNVAQLKWDLTCVLEIIKG